MSDAAIRVDNVCVDYSVRGHAQRRILNGIDLQIGRGEFVSIVGQTGCGKSTLLRLMLGEEKPTSGRVLINGTERSQPDRLCGYVPQKYSLFPDKTVLDNVTFGLRCRSSAHSRCFIRPAAKRYGSFAPRHCTTWSSQASTKRILVSIRISFQEACSSGSRLPRR